MKKVIGVWLDHSKAKLIKLQDCAAEITTVLSPYKRHIRIPGESSNKTRFGMKYYSNQEYNSHHKKQHDLNSYYKEMEIRLSKFDEILLFGPTEAKKELYNHMSENKVFSSKAISLENADKMTEKEMAAYVKSYFSKFNFSESVDKASAV